MELVLWLPFFLVLLAVITDLSLILKMQTRMYDVAAQASPSVSYGTTPAAAENYVRGEFPADNIEVSIVFDGTGNWVTTTITSSFGEAMLFGADLFKEDNAFDSIKALDVNHELTARASAYVILPGEGGGGGGDDGITPPDDGTPTN